MQVTCAILNFVVYTLREVERQVNFIFLVNFNIVYVQYYHLNIKIIELLCFF